MDKKTFDLKVFPSLEYTSEIEYSTVKSVLFSSLSGNMAAAPSREQWELAILAVLNWEPRNDTFGIQKWLLKYFPRLMAPDMDIRTVLYTIQETARVLVKGPPLTAKRLVPRALGRYL